MSGDYRWVPEYPSVAAGCTTYYPTITPWTGNVTLRVEPQAGLLALVRALLTAVENKTISEETMKQVLDLLDKG